MRNVPLFLAVLLSAKLAVAQQSALSGPVEGFTFDVPTGSFRAVLGLPGAAALGSPLLSGFEFGVVAPGKNYGIAFQDGHAIIVSGLDSSQVLTSEILDVTSRAEGALWSADGSQAILYSLTGKWIQLAAGLPDAPKLNPCIDISSLGTTFAAIASDRSATRIAVAIQGDSGGVYVMDGDRSFVPVIAAVKPISLAFSEDGRTLYVLESGGQVTELVLGDSSSRVWHIDGLQDPVAIQTARDTENRPVVYVAARADRILRAYDVSTRQAASDMQLDFEPTVIETLGNSRFLLSPRLHNGDPLWRLTNVPRTMVYFVPATPVTAGGSE